MKNSSTQAEDVEGSEELQESCPRHIEEQGSELFHGLEMQNNQNTNSLSSTSANMLRHAHSEEPNDTDENIANHTIFRAQDVPNLPGAYRVGGSNSSIAGQCSNDSTFLPQAIPVTDYSDNDEHSLEDFTIDGEIVNGSTRKSFMNIKEAALIVLVSVVVLGLVSQVSRFKKKIPSTLSREEVIKDLLIPISGEEVLNDPTSPQHRAFNYIVRGDPLEIPLNNTKKIIQRYSVIALGLSIATPSFSKSIGLNKFSVKDECDLGIGVCNDDGEMLGYHFARLSTLADKSNLTKGLGTISKEIGQLTSLTHLLLYDNQIVGTIPTEIGLLKNLQVLDLRNNLLDGPIPSYIGHLEGMKWLFLSNNELSGTIPKQIGNLAKLFYSDVSKNLLTGAIPSEVAKLSDLSGLALQENNLSGNAEFLCGQIVPMSSFEVVLEDLDYSQSVNLGFSIDCTNSTTKALNCSCCQCT